jgi:aspartate carbamoyltransferase regulatory subunit
VVHSVDEASGLSPSATLQSIRERRVDEYATPSLPDLSERMKFG